MASNNFINECKNNAYKNRLGTISIKDITKKSGSVITTDEAIEGPLNDYKVYGNTVQSKLPDGYTQVDYIESSGTQYIDTGWYPDYSKKFEIEATINPQVSDKRYCILSNYLNTSKYNLSLEANVNNKVRFYINSSSANDLISSNTIEANKFTTIKFNYNENDSKYSILMNGISSEKTTNVSKEKLSLSAYLFVDQAKRFNAFNSALQLKRISIKEGDKLIRDFIPCYRNSDNEVGLYDLVNDVFYTNQGTGVFTYGSVALTPNAPIEIVSCGDRTKNLLNVSSTYTVERITIDFSLQPGTYIVSCEKPENYRRLLFFRWKENADNGNYVFIEANTTNTEFTITKEVSKLNFYSRDNASASTGNTTTYKNLMIRKSNISDGTYEPYGYKIPINVRSENLFDISEITSVTNGTLSNNIITTNTSGNVAYFNVAPIFPQKKLLSGHTYYLSADIRIKSGAGSFGKINDYVADWTRLISPTISDVFQKYIFKKTFTADTSYYRFLFQFRDVNNAVFEIKNIMLSEVDEDYQPYYNETTNIYLDEPLRKSDDGTYVDHIDFENKKVYRQIKEITLNGTEAWSRVGAQNNHYRFRVNRSDLKIGAECVLYCTHFKNNGDSYSHEGISGSTGHVLYIRWDELFETVDDLKTWLASNTPIVDYVLETPIEENIELPNINLIEGKNIITLGTELESIIEVEYTNWENKIKNSDRLQKVTIDNGCIVNNEIIGSVYSKKVTSDILDINELDLENKKIDVKIGVKYDNESHETLNMGKYTIERPKDEQTVNMGQITAYDDLNSKLEDKYICGIDYTQGNITLRDLYIDLCNQLELTPKNLEFDNNTIPIANNPFTNGEKNRLVLQTIEKVSGTFSDIDNDTNEIDLCWLSNSVEPDYIFYRNDYTNLEGGKIVYGPINCLVIKNSQIDDENVTIKDDESIALNGEHTLTINEDYILYNSELRQLAINAIWNKVHNLTYVDCKLTTLYGKPFLKLGDKIRVYKTDTEYFDTYVLLHNFIYDGSFESTIQSPVLTEQEIKTKQKISLREALKNTEVEVNKQKQTITALVQETSENTEKTSQLQLQSDEINQRIEDSQYYIDEDGNKQTISSSINELKNTAEELNLNLQKIGGLNLMKNSSGQNGTIGYKGKMLKPYIEFQTWNEFNQYISTSSAVNDIYTCFIHVVGESNDSMRDCWYGLYYQDGYSRRYYYEQVVWNGNYIYPDKYNFHMDFMYDELFTFVETNYTDTESFKKFLIDYTNEYTNISPNIFSSMTNDFIENNTIAKSAFLLIPTVRDTYTSMDEDYIYGESFTVPSNANKLYFSVKSKIDGLCGKARLILYQLDDKMDNIQNNLNVYDFWTNHVISETVISIPDNLLNSDSFEEYKREVDILDNTVDILPCFSIGNNFVNDGVYVNFKNPILNPINRFYWKKVWETIDEVSAYYTYRSIHTKKKLQFFESSTVPEIPNTPDFTQLWLCTEDIDTYTKDKLYTPQYEVDNTGTILSKTWIATDYTKEQIENNVEIIMFDGWTYVYSAMGEMDATPRPDMKFLIADCMVSTTDTSWQPASGENYWGKNIKISGDKGIYIYNTVDGYNRIIDEKQDIATDNSGNTLWQLTGKGMKTKRAECESIRLPKLEILCTSDSTAFYHKENEGDDYGA